ncbi:hypothetical protein [Rhodococcus sp. ACT016]|uniref:hypothetical protein n=1 Tax=Rhodococcus sp. ACT016 TaxID=3134808 RepID=UPI003D27F710
MTFVSEDVTFTVVASVDTQFGDIDRMAQARWDAIFADSRRPRRTTQPRLVDVSPASDGSAHAAYHFTGTLLD